MWLLLLRRRDESSGRPLRPTPISPDELGRLVMQAARNHDLQTYRQMFLNSGEAADLLGDDAGLYIDARTPKVLSDSLQEIAQALPAGARFTGTEVDDDDRLKLLVTADTDPVRVDVGSVVEVGVAWRLFGPARI